MKKNKLISLFLLAGCLYGQLLPGQTKKRALFLGNSYTASNNLPSLVAQMATSTGDTLVWISYPPGGYTLQGHAGNSSSLNYIRQGQWDYVILQEQSQLPSFPNSVVESEVYPYARFLDSVIHATNACAQTMFFMTWGRKNGDTQNCSDWPLVCTYQGMDSLLRLRYQVMASQNEALLSPVGAVWRYIRSNHPDIELYTPDNSHPSVAGSYAAACSFYTALFRKDPAAVSFNFSLPADQARRIRESARSVVYDSLLYWHIGAYDTRAEFDVSYLGNNRIQCNDQSGHWQDGLWLFGDGTRSTELNPVHEYAQGGIYEITRIVQNCFSSDTTLKRIRACPPGNPGCDTIRRYAVYPNPTRQQIWLEVPEKVEVRIVNAVGQQMLQPFRINAEKRFLDVSSWPSGLYVVWFQTSGVPVRQSFIKW